MAAPRSTLNVDGNVDTSGSHNIIGSPGATLNTGPNFYSTYNTTYLTSGLRFDSFKPSDLTDDPIELRLEKYARRIGSDPERSDLRVRKPDGYIPADLLLHVTTLVEDVEVMRYLVDNYDADVNSATTDLFLWTPLHTAALNGRAKMVTTLITVFGADVNAKGFRDWTPLHCAALNGNSRAMRELARCSVARAITAPPRTYSMHASKHRDAHNRRVGGNMGVNYANAVAPVRHIERLDVEARALDSWTPLHLAAANGHTDAAQVLVLELRAKINARVTDHGIGTSYGATPLYIAKKMAKWDVVRLLAMNGAIDRSYVDWFFNETRLGRLLFRIFFYETPIYLVIGRYNFPPFRRANYCAIVGFIVLFIIIIIILSNMTSGARSYY